MRQFMAFVFTVLASQCLAGENYCLALNIYHEARGESEEAQAAVAHVTLNRVASPRFPNSICAVVQQAKRNDKGALIRHRCQFSWFCDGLSDKPKDAQAWERAQRIASIAKDWHELGEDFSQGALFYHADHIRPYWADAFEKSVHIDQHIFYR